MWYLTSDATGMTFIARCLETIRGILINMPDNRITAMVAKQTHNLELLEYRVKGVIQEGDGHTPAMGA